VNSMSRCGRATARCTISLADELRHQLTQVVHGYTGPCDEPAARKAMEWMRAKDLDRRHRPTGLALLLLNDLVGAGKQARQNEKGGA
jgi:hypothetical protein